MKQICHLAYVTLHQNITYYVHVVVASVVENDLMKHITDKTNNYIYSDKLLMQLFPILINLSLLCIWKVEYRFLPGVFLFAFANHNLQRIKSVSAGVFLLLRTVTADLIQPA